MILRALIWGNLREENVMAFEEMSIQMIACENIWTTKQIDRESLYCRERSI